MNSFDSTSFSHSQIVNGLAPHLVAICPVPEDVNVHWIPARSLLCKSKRFDVIFKYLYARARIQNESCAFFDSVYYESIKALSGGKFEEGDGSKKNFDAFKKSFDELIDSIVSKGFCVDISIIPVNKDYICIDGAHRVAVAAALGLNVPVVNMMYEGHCYDVQFFKDRYMPQKYVDYGILTWVEENSRMHIFNVHKCASGHDDEIDSILQKYGKVYAKKTISLSLNGYKWMSWVFYRCHDWGHCFVKNRDAIMGHVAKCGIGKEKLRVYVVECDSLDAALEAKQEIRKIFKIGNSAVHASDTHEEATELAQFYFNENSMHFIQNSSLMDLEWGREIINDLRMFKNNVCQCGGRLRDAMIDGSFSLALYGLRSSKDIDFLTSDSYLAPQLEQCGYDEHSSQLVYHLQSVMDLLHDSDNYFYAEGVKVLSLPALARMKRTRLEEKDCQDVALINKILKQSPVDYMRIKIRAFMFAFFKNKDVFFPEGTIRRRIARLGKHLFCKFRY